MSLIEIHNRLALTAIFYFLILSLWGYIRFFRKQGMDPAFWGAVVIGEILLLLQTGIGGYMWMSGLRPDQWAHYMYGIITPMALPMVYMYTQGRQERGEMLLYSTTMIITVVLIIRAMNTGVSGL